MKLCHIALAGLTAVTFSSAALAGGGAHQQRGEAQDSQQQSSMSQSSPSPELVRQAQAELSNKGHDLKIDGQWGPQTQSAVKDFQQSQGLQASGQLDQQTIAALGVSGEDPSSSTGSSAAPASPKN